MSKVTYKELLENRRRGSAAVVCWVRAYCDYSEGCETCDGRVRFLCRVKYWLEKIQTRIILNIIRKNEKKSDVL